MIEDFIKDLFDDENSIDIQRNDLAEKFNCVPSQINYVISTRFKPSQGYYVESKRGGGGHITIKKINITKSNYLMHIISSVGDKITAQEVSIFISNFLSYGIVTETEAKLLKVATSDNVLTVDPKDRDELRANIFKNMLLNLNMTVTIAHSHTSKEDLKRLVANSDLIIVAVGKPNFITNEFNFKKGAYVFDVGINRVDGKLVGDCEPNLNVEFQSPVPGGVGLLTRLSLILNLLEVYKDEI